MAEIRVPALGESVTEATIGKWFKKPGEGVAVDEPLVELETDKVTIEVPSPAAGVLADIAAKDGDTVAVGAVLGQIKEGASGASEDFAVAGAGFGAAAGADCGGGEVGGDAPGVAAAAAFALPPGRRRSPRPPPRCRCGHQRRLTMPRARSACA